jgi:plasmid stability protein
VKKTTKPQSFTISFRLDAAQLAELEKRAARHKISIHEEARNAVTDLLNDTRRDEIKEEVLGARDDIKILEMKVADAVEALLITAGNYPKDQAKEWTNEIIRRG